LRLIKAVIVFGGGFGTKLGIFSLVITDSDIGAVLDMINIIKIIVV